MTDSSSARPTAQPAALSRVSAQDLLQLGLDQVAYIRKYHVRGEIAWVLHGADGAALAVQKTAAEAIGEAQGRDLDVVTIH